MNTLLEDRGLAARRLIERVHDAGDALAHEYPLIFGQDDVSGRLIAVGEGDEVRSACSILVRDFVMPGARVRGGLIGSVATDPEWRGQGLGTRLLVEAEAALQMAGCTFGLLWADDPTYYLDRGYCPIGTEHDFAFERADAARLPRGEGVRPFASGDAEAVHALYQAHPTRVERSARETAALLGCPGMETLVVERDGVVRAYACLGRGRDLADAVHEWGGAVQDVLALIRAHHERHFAGANGALFLMAPPAATELLDRLDALGLRTKRGILGLGKLLDRRSAAELLERCIEPRGSVELGVSDGTERFLLRGPRREGWLNDDGALTLLFPNAAIGPEVEAFLAEFGFERGRLPLEPFAWGLDSI